MEQGLAQQMVYGDGQGQNTKHYYAGKKKKASSCGCSSKSPGTPRKKKKCGCSGGCAK
jgi:hypothetical protein